MLLFPFKHCFPPPLAVFHLSELIANIIHPWLITFSSNFSSSYSFLYLSFRDFYHSFWLPIWMMIWWCLCLPLPSGLHGRRDHFWAQFLAQRVLSWCSASWMHEWTSGNFRGRNQNFKRLGGKKMHGRSHLGTSSTPSLCCVFGRTRRVLESWWGLWEGLETSAGTCQITRRSPPYHRTRSLLPRDFRKRTTNVERSFS